MEKKIAPKTMNRGNMYGVFNKKGHLMHYSLGTSVFGAIGNFLGGLPGNWEYYSKEGYFTHKVHVFITPLTTVKTFNNENKNSGDKQRGTKKPKA